VLKNIDSAIIPMVPKVAEKLRQLGIDVLLERDAGKQAFYSDSDYEGCACITRDEILNSADAILSKNFIPDLDLPSISGKYYFSEFQPFNDKTVAQKLSSDNVTGFSLDMIPRISRAQSMDVLSSMANIAGYQAVLSAAEKLPRYFPMMMTAAGTVKPAKVLVIGAGVAGLQAIATAKRLGAVVEAFDTRSAVKEEVESLGGKFVEVEGATDNLDAGGYAVEQSEDYKKRQQELVRQHAAAADVVIATAQLRGRPAPLIIPEQTVEAMKPGSVIVDLAASTGGNAAFSMNKETIVHKEITIIGDSNLADLMPQTASELYANNVYNYLRLFMKDGRFTVDMEDEIIADSLLKLD